MIPTKDSPLWGKVWERLERSFENCGAVVTARNPGIRFQIGHWGNDTSPFWAWATFGRQDPAREDLVISVTFRRTDGALQLSTDLMEEQGPILSEIPRQTLDVSDLSDAEMTLEVYLHRVEAFIEAETERIATII
jgi:hypothetical protein